MVAVVVVRAMKTMIDVSSQNPTDKGTIRREGLVKYESGTLRDFTFRVGYAA
jgi:hypothetical protein